MRRHTDRFIHYHDVVVLIGNRHFVRNGFGFPSLFSHINLNGVACLQCGGFMDITPDHTCLPGFDEFSGLGP